MPARLIACALGLALFAGCRSTDRALSPVAPRTAAPTRATFDLPEAYEILDVTYSSSLVALDDEPDEDDVRERASVQVFARHRESGDEALFVYDLTRPGAAPATVIRFRRVPGDQVPGDRPLRPERRW